MSFLFLWGHSNSIFFTSLSFQFKKPIQFRTQYFYIYYLSKAITNLNIHYSVFLPEFFFEPIRFQTNFILKTRAGWRKEACWIIFGQWQRDYEMAVVRRPCDATVAAARARGSHGWKEKKKHADKKEITYSIIFY
jgi:hypothetical protein